jgi:uncharacterized protein (TIGR03382 family)
MAPLHRPPPVRSARAPLLAAGALALLAARPAAAADYTVAAGGDWCAVLSATLPGDRVLLGPGTHTTGCALTLSGVAGSPITLAAADPLDPPRLSPTDGSAAIVSWTGSHLVVEGLTFGPHAAGEAGLRLLPDTTGEVRGVELRGNQLVDLGGVGLEAAAAGALYEDIVVVENTMARLGGAGVALGCSAGAVDCRVGSATVEANLIEDTGLSGAGAGVELRPDSAATIARNVIRRSPGALIDVHGGLAQLPADGAGNVLARVEANRLGPPTSGAAIRVYGGPTLVRNNVVIGGVDGGILSVEGPVPGQLDRIYLLGNTVLASGGDAITLLGWSAGVDLAMQNNAVLQEDRLGEGLPTPGGAVAVGGNQSCAEPALCFADRAALDLSPTGPLLGGAIIAVHNHLDVDLCGLPRVLPGDAVGALGAESALLTGWGTAGAPADLYCPSPDSGTADGADGADGTTDGGDGGGGDGGSGDDVVVRRVPAYARAKEGGGFGCAAAPGGPAVAALLAAALAGVRRRRRLSGP